MKAPKQNSNALSARDTRGLPEGNGRVGESTMEGDSLFIFACGCAVVAGVGDPGKDARQAPPLTEVNALGYSNAPDAARFR